MPILTCSIDSKPGFKWGAQGKCFTYNKGSKKEKDAAKEKALAQGRAIEINKASVFPFQEFSPPTPVEFKTIDEVWTWLEDKLPASLEPVLNGVRVIIHKKADKIEMWFADNPGINMLGAFPQLEIFMKRAKGDGILDADLTIIRDGKRIPDEEIKRLNKKTVKLADNEKLRVTISDTAFINKSLSDNTFTERIEALDDLFDDVLSEINIFQLSKLVAIKDLDSLKKSILFSKSQDTSKGSLIKINSSKYPLMGETDQWGLLNTDGSVIKKAEISDHTEFALAAIGYGAESKVENLELECVIFKADDERQVAYSVVTEPNFTDAHGDHMTAEDIMSSAHFWMAQGAVIGDQHKRFSDAVAVESYIAPVTFTVKGPNGTQVVKVGTWIIAIHIPDKKVWAKVKSGEIGGVSVGGFGLRK